MHYLLVMKQDVASQHKGAVIHYTTCLETPLRGKLRKTLRPMSCRKGNRLHLSTKLQLKMQRFVSANQRNVPLISFGSSKASQVV